jgi:hypothetical protein
MLPSVFSQEFVRVPNYFILRCLIIDRYFNLHTDVFVFFTSICFFLRSNVFRFFRLPFTIFVKHISRQ